MRSTKTFQVLSALILHYHCLCTGIMFGWPSSMMLLFKSAATPLDRPMTDAEISLFGSLSCIGALVGSPLAGFFLDRLGRKGSTAVLGVVATLSWSLLAFGSNVVVILTAVLLSGICASTFLVVPVFVSEISEESIRGTLTSITTVCSALGFLISYSFRGVLEYTTGLYIALSMSSIGLMLLMLLKETPTLLLNKGMNEEARKSMGFYRNNHPDSKLVLDELEKIKCSLIPKEKELLSTEEMRLYSEDHEKQSSEKVSTWESFKRSQSSQRALAVAMILMTLCICQGMIVVQIYSKLVFSKTVPAEVLSVTWCSVLLSLVTVIFGFISSYLTDAVGRRALMIFSSFTCGVLSVFLGTQIHYYWGPDWLTIVLVYLFCSAYNLGSGTVPYMLPAELFLPDVRSVLSMIVFEWHLIVNFIILFTFNHLVSIVGLGPVFYIFCTVCFLNTAFCAAFLPETKGLTVDAIQLLLVKPKEIGPE